MVVLELEYLESEVIDVWDKDLVILAEQAIGVYMELAFVGMSVKSMLLESLEYLVDMLSVIRDVVRVDQYVVQVNHYRDIEHVRENVVHKMLEGGRHIRKSERHNVPFEGAIAGAECCFPFIAIGDADQVICVSEIDLGVNPGLPGSM